MEVKALLDRAIDDARPRRRAGALLSLAAAVVAMVAALALLLPSLARAQTTFGSSGSGAGQLSNPADAAVEQSSGDVYVSDRSNNRIAVFSADGTFIRAFGWGVTDGASSLETCTATCQAGVSGSGAGQFDNPTAVAVDQSTGDIYVADSSNYRVEKFDSSGNFILMFGGGVDKTTGGNVCTAASGDTCGKGSIGSGDSQFWSGWRNASPAAFIAVDGAGTVYVGDALRVEEFDASGNFVDEFQTPLPAGSSGSRQVAAVAVGPSGNVYTAYRLSNNRLQEWSPSGTLIRTISGGQTSDNEPQALAVDGLGDLFVRESSDGVRVLEYDPRGDLVASFPLAPVTDATGGIAFADSSQTLYAVDRDNDEVVALSTAPPPGPYVAPASVKATDVAFSDATFNAIVNPEGQAAGYHFEYGLTSSYGQRTAGGSLGADSAFHKVTAYLTGLVPFTTYHFRIVVGNFKGPDHTFTTYPTPGAQSCANSVFRNGYGASLPDCRAYEQVSPVDKGHNDALKVGAIVSPSGDAASFYSFNAFAGSPSSGNGVGYSATRSATAWQTHPLGAGLDTQVGPAQGNTFEMGATPDLTKVLVGTYKALTPGAVEGNANLYIRDAVTGSYQFVATAPAQLFQFTLHFGGASPDGTRWVFATQSRKWALDSTPPPPSTARFKENLYEFSAAGGLQLVGILPDGSVDPHGSVQAGSDDRSVATHAVSTDARRIYWTEPGFGSYPVYLREGDDTKLVSHDEAGAAQNGTFWYATPDGSTAFITSSAGLTSDASPSGSDLYRYDAKSGDLTDLTPDSTDPGGADVTGVFGAGDDGSYVYFLATGDLASGATAGEENIYVRHGGTTRFIGTLASDASDITSGFASGIGLQWRVSPDGRGFGFLFDGAISGPDPQQAQRYDQAYYYSYGDDALDCASCMLNGGEPTGAETFVPNVSAVVLWGMNGSSFATTNGGRLFFTSPDRLLPGDVNDAKDVYEYERDGSGSCGSAAINGGCLYLISTGHGGTGAVLTGASASGRDVFFITYDKLVGQDRDNNSDLYDARIGGGLASQNPPAPAKPCVGGDCKGALAPSLSPSEPGSARFSGPGDARGGKHAAVFHVRALSRRQQRRLVRGRRIALRVRVSEHGRVRAVMHARFRRRGHRGHVRRVARASRRARHGGTVRLRLRLSRHARRYLRHHRRLRVAVRVRYSRVQGAQRARFTLRHARHRRHHRRARMRHRAAQAQQRGGRR